MAVTNFASKSSAALGGSTDTLAYGTAVTAGSLLFVEVRMGTAATLNTVSDSVNAGNWTLLGPTDNVGRQYLAYMQNSGSGTPTVTLTFSASGQSPRWTIGEVTNTIGASSFDASDILATGTGTALAANAQTGATATYAQIGLMSISANETFTQNGAWTILGVEPAAGTSRLAVVYQELTSSASRAPAVDCGSSSTWIAFSFMVKQNAASSSPFVPLDQPNPTQRSPRDLSVQDPSEFWMLRDTQFGAAGQPKTYDWPNPLAWDARSRGQPSVSLKTWTNSYLLGLIGKDLQFGAAGQWKTYDYPNPRGATPGITLKTFTNSYTLALIGKDAFFSAPGVGPAYDYPNPRGATPSIDLRTHLWNPLITLLSVVIVVPFAFFDWVNPWGPKPNQSLKTHIDPLKSNLYGKDTFFGVPGQPPANLDWPVPQSPKRSIGLRTFLGYAQQVGITPVSYVIAKIRRFERNGSNVGRRVDK